MNGRDTSMDQVRHLVMIGGGQSAKGLLAAAAEMLARGNRALPRLRITVVESGWEFGTGLAWSRQYALPEHLSSLAEPYSRVAYGDRQQAQFHGLVRLLGELGVRVTLLPGRTVIAVEPRAGVLRVTLTTPVDGGREALDAHFVVLGTGHWRAPDPLAGCPGYHASPWPAGRLQDAVFDDHAAGSRQRHDILILGTYLSGIDAALTLAFRCGTFHADADGRMRFEAPDNVRITLASRTGFLPKVWGRAPQQYQPRWFTESALDALIADPAHEGLLPLDGAFELLARELAAARRPAAAARTGRGPSLPVLLRRLRNRRGSTTAAHMRRDIAAVTATGRPWGTYADARPSAWQEVLFAALPIWSEYSHALSAEDQAFFDREARTLYFAYTMPMTLDNAVRVEAMMRSGHLQALTLGSDYVCRPSRGSAGSMALCIRDPRGATRTLQFQHVVNATGQSADVRHHPAPVMRQLLGDGLAQPALRRFRREPPAACGEFDGAWRGRPTEMHGGVRYLVTGGLYVNPRTCAVIPRGRLDAAPAETRRATLFAMGPNVMGQFVDAQGIGQIERDARRILTAVSRTLA